MEISIERSISKTIFNAGMPRRPCHLMMKLCNPSTRSCSLFPGHRSIKTSRKVPVWRRRKVLANFFPRFLFHFLPARRKVFSKSRIKPEWWRFRWMEQQRRWRKIDTNPLCRRTAAKFPLVGSFSSVFRPIIATRRPGKTKTTETDSSAVDGRESSAFSFY